MDRDWKVSGRNGVLGRHSGCTYIHPMCGGFHIQAHMVARTRQSHKRVQRGATTAIRKGRTRTERGFIVARSTQPVHFVYGTDFHCSSRIQNFI